LLKLTSYYLICLQAIKLALIPYTGVQNWVIDGFKHPLYTFYPPYPGWNSIWLTNPYSIFWQIWYSPVSVVGWLPFMWFMWSFDSVLLIVVNKFQSPIYTLAFAISSWYLFISNPADILILWLAVLGKEAPIMSLFAAITKLPTFAPAYVWQFIFASSLNHGNIFVQEVAWPRYFFLGIWILHPFLIKLYWRFK